MALNYSAFEELASKLKYGQIISRNKEYVLSSPRNDWDTNYSLYDEKESLVYLIDTGDVHDNVDDLEEYGGILFQDLINLDIYEIRDAAWKIEKDGYPLPPALT